MDAVDMLCEFIEVAFHEILAARDVYPKEVFENRRRYGLQLRMSRHPELNKYIYNALDGARPWMKKDKVHSVVLSLLDPQQRSRERFVFDMAISETQAAVSFNQEELAMKLKMAAQKLKLYLSHASASSDVPSTFSVMIRTRENEILDEEKYVGTTDTEAVTDMSQLKAIAYVDAPVLLNMYSEVEPQR